MPPKGPFFTDPWSWMKSSARHTLSNQQSQLQKLRLVNLSENAAQDSLFVALNMHLTLHLLLFKQSM